MGKIFSENWILCTVTDLECFALTTNSIDPSKLCLYSNIFSLRQWNFKNVCCVCVFTVQSNESESQQYFDNGEKLWNFHFTSSIKTQNAAHCFCLFLLLFASPTFVCIMRVLMVQKQNKMKLKRIERGGSNGSHTNDDDFWYGPNESVLYEFDKSSMFQ